MDIEQLAKKIEIMLFLEGEEVNINEIAKRTKAKKEEIESAINFLREKYNNMDITLTILKRGDSYLMTIKPSYIDIARTFTRERELTKKELSLLVIIDKNKGIKKALLAKRLGKHVYSLIKKLKKAGFLKEEKKGRDTFLWTTEKYEEYKKEISR